jgi:hypothetical protein
MSPEQWKASRQGPATLGPTTVEEEEEASLSPEQWKAKRAQQIVTQNLPQEGTLAGARQAQDVGRDTEYQFDPRVPQLSAVLGAAIGATPYGRAAKGASALGGSIRGGIEGGIAGTVGESVRTASGNSNYGQAAALGVEMALGTGANLAYETIQRAKAAALGATFGYQPGKTLQTILGGTPESELMAQERAFGVRSMKPGVMREVATQKTQQELSEELANNYGVVLQQEAKASDAVRQNLYTKLADEVAQGRPLLVTERTVVKDPVTNRNRAAFTVKQGEPEFVNLLTRLEEGVRVGAVKPADLNSIRSMLNGQVSADPKFATEFNQKLINTIQQTVPEWNGVKISDDAAALTREAFDTYLQRVNNGLGYNALKTTEQREFTAKALDSIPVVLSYKFNPNEDVVKKAIENIHRSPEGQRSFQVALGSYFKNIPIKDQKNAEGVVTAWNRLDPILWKNKTLPRDEHIKLRRAVKEYSERGLSGKAKDVALVSLRNAIARSVIPAEAASLLTFGEPEETQYTL